MPAAHDPTLLAIDPSGCGCTECLIGEYRPLDAATDEDIQALFNGEIGDNTSTCWLVQENSPWDEERFTIYGGPRPVAVSRIAFPVPVENYRLEARKETIEAIHSGFLDHLGADRTS